MALTHADDYMINRFGSQLTHRNNGLACNINADLMSIDSLGILVVEY